MMIRVTALNMYPVKSCAATPLEVAELDARGIRHDREFMLVDRQRRFLTQREQPRLALIVPRRTDTSLELSAPGMPPLSVEPLDGRRETVTIWRDRVVAADQGEEAADWLSSYLGQPVRLVRLPGDVVRPVDPHFASRPDAQVSLADAFPLLLISEESLADLNTRLDQPLPMNRFRPNVVCRGAGVPYAEDSWAELQIGELAFSVVKACARCVTTTTDQLTAERGREPLATLATYRRVARGVLFGQNLIHATPGRIAIGDPLRICRAVDPPTFLPAAADVA
jgi:uncharacterized protein YcbX